MPKTKPEGSPHAFGARLTALLADNDVPRHGAGKYLADRYKVSTVTANAWLNGEHKSGIPIARKIAKDHGTTFEALYFGGAEQPSVIPDESIESQIDELRLVIGVIFSSMVIHRPTEAKAVAAQLRRAVPARIRNAGFVGTLTAALDKAGGS